MIARLKKFALPISLAFNVFFVAVVGSHLWFRPPPHGPHEHGPHDIVERIAQTLPEADAMILRREFGPGALPPPPPRPGSPDDDIERIRRLLANEPFDPAVLEQILRAGQERHQQFDQALAGALMRAVTAMSPEGRHRLAAWQPPHPPPPPPPR